MLPEKEFDTLRTIALNQVQLRRELVEATGYSLGTINKMTRFHWKRIY